MGLPDGGLGVKGKERAWEGGHQRAASASEEAMGGVGKRARKRWTREETQMLIDGCKDVRPSQVSEGLHLRSDVWTRSMELGIGRLS